MDKSLLDLTNYRDHPNDGAYKVFFFHQPERADMFESMLAEEGIFFERSDADEDDHRILFAIKRIDLTRVEHINNLTAAEHKKPFIPSTFWRWALLIFFASTLLLAFIGWCVSNGRS